VGYFSNATEGADYERTWCRKCQHGDGDSAGDCAVWEAHLLANHTECERPGSPLHVLIPRGLAENAKCRMFVRGGQRRLF
jgi:hypothetical protein